MNGIGIQVRILGLLAVGTVCSLIACAGGGASPGAAIPPSTGTPALALKLEVPDTNGLDSVAVSVDITGTTNTAVTWSVDSIPNGNETVGTISGTGTSVTYIAPEAPGTHTITVTSQADPTKTASFPIRVKSPGMTVSLSPTSANIPIGGQLSLAATVSGSRNGSVKWAVDGVVDGNTAIGTLVASGNTATYTAPASAGNHTVSAISLANSAVRASAAIVVQPTPPVQVTLLPGSTTLLSDASLSFTATVSNATNTAVTWTVDDVLGGNATVGTLAGSGNTVIYTAPTQAGIHTIKATSVADATKSAASALTILVPTTVSVSLIPGATTLASGATLSFTATVTGTTNTAVTWMVDAIVGGNATVGTITGTGTTVTYTAPTTAGSHIVRVVSVADDQKSTASIVTVLAPVQVSLSPGTTNLPTSGTQSFTATVSGSTNTTVTWTVDDISGGNATVGTLAGTGATVTYTAPNAAGTHTIKATSAADATKSASSTITIQAPIQVSLSPGATTLAGGATQFFTASVTGSANTDVTWMVDNILGGNATAGTIAGAGATATYTAPVATGLHTIKATSVADPSKSASSAITIQAPVQVTLSPGASTLSTAATLTFTAAVFNASTPAVTWTVDDINGGNATVGTIAGTGATVTYTAPATVGTHTIKAASVADATKSASSILTIQAPDQVSLSPGATTLASAASLSFTATVTGSTSVTWVVDNIAGGNATVGTITGTGTTVLYTAPVGAGTHTIKATSVADPSKSASSVVTVQAPIAVALSPGATTLPSAATLAFTATVTGSTNTAVTWMVDSVVGGNATVGTIAGTGATATYTAPATAGSHTIQATSVADATKSASSVVTVQAPVAVALSPGATTLASGAPLAFTATVTGTTNTAVTWMVDSVVGGNATVGTIAGTGATATYTAPAAAGSHTIQATSVADATKSASSVVTVQAPVAVALSPGASTLASAAPLAFTATVTGTTNTAVTWMVDSVVGGNATVGTIAGTGATATYTAPATAGSHTIKATSVADATKSASSVVTVQAPVAVALSPGATTLASGAPLAFTATVTGTTNTAVTWMVDSVVGGNATVGTIAGTGATATYTAPATAGSHTIKATSVADATKSASSVVAVQATVAVALSPGTTTLASGAPLAFTATVTGTTNTAVTWMVDAIVGGNATVGTITGTGATVTYTAPTAAGSHIVRVVSVADNQKSTASTVTIQAAVAVSMSPTSASISTGATASLTATVAGTTNTAVTWAVDSVPGGNATVGTITGTGNAVTYTAPGTAGSHSVVATSVADTLKTGSTAITVLPPAPVTVAISPTTSNLSVSTTTSFTASVTGTSNTAVTWTVDGVTNGNTTVGTITGSGNTVTYTAPGTAGTRTVKATSVQDSSKYYSASVVVSSGATVTLGPLAAFPGCEGMGSGATGGRGGVVYTVNTLADTTNSGVVAQNGPNGPTCSLRDAMTKSGPRTIVFSVGGTITLNSTIYSVPAGMTIAGHTAPGGGIQIRGNGTFGSGGSMLWFGGNTIIRYLRLRPGNAPVNASQQGLTALSSLDSGISDVVMDHNSFEWDGNKAVSFWSATGVRRSTFSWNIDAEGMAPHSTGLLIGGNVSQSDMDTTSWDGHHNVLATIDHRLPHTWLKYGRWINNYVHGYGYAMLVRGGMQADIIGNVWDGIDSGINATSSKNEVRWADTVAHNEGNLVPSGTAQIYMSNNFGPHNPNGTSDNYTTMFRVAASENSQLDNNVVSSAYKASGPTIPASLNAWPITITPLSTKEDLKTLLAPTVGAYRRLACDGSWVANRDSLDTRIINYILNSATSPTDYVFTAPAHPTLSAGTPCADSDGDGMPDIWEDAHGLNKIDASDRNTIRANANGYTNLELYLSGLFPNGTPLP